MPQITERQNRSTFGEQRIANNFPPDSKARYAPYSNLKQAAHPFVAAIHELAVNQERTWHNFFYQTLDPTELDVIYTAPRVFNTNFEILGYIDSTTTALLGETDADLDSFWYTPCPTRLSYQGEECKVVYPTRQARQLMLGAKYDKYILGTHVEDHFFSSTDVSPWTLAPVGSASLNFVDSGGWGNGPALEFDFDIPAATQANIDATATETATGKTICFSGQFQTPGTALTNATIEIGYQGVGSAIYNFTPDMQWQRQTVHYTPPSPTQTGIPYVNIQADKSAGIADQLYISDYHLFQPNQIHEDTTIAYPVRSMTPQSPSWAYVVVSGGTNLMDVDTSFIRPPMPSSITIEGINANGRRDTETIYTPINGVHKGIKLWHEIIGTRVDAINPYTAEISVQLQNYQSTDTVPDLVEHYASPTHEGPLFYNLENTNGTSFLGYGSFLVTDLLQTVDGYDAVVPFFEIELLDENGSSHDLLDMKLDLSNRHLYTLSTNGPKIYMYDVLPPWPSQDKLALFKTRTPFPDIKIKELDEHEVIAKRGEVIQLEANWRNRYKTLLQTRWQLHKPDGTVVGLDLAASEYASTADYWVYNEQGIDGTNGEYKFAPQIINYTATDYGDYVAKLEAVYVDEDNQEELISEIDCILFSVHGREPLKVLELPDADSDPVGLDFDPYGNIRVAYTTDNSDILKEKIYSRHWDYFMSSVDENKIYLREKYLKVLFREALTDVACEFAKKVLIVNGDTVLTVDDIDNGHIVLNVTSNTVDVTLPSGVGLAEDGVHCTFKKWGTFQARILPSGGKTIDTLASRIIPNDKDAEHLVYVHSLGDWNRL